MKFLVDVNASGALAHWLTDMGHDVVQVREFDAKMPDDKILSWAVQEQRIIITTDRDFEEMIWREGKQHCGILRLDNLPRSDRKALLMEVLIHHSDALLSGSVVIALRQKIRIRKSIPRS